MSFRKSSITLVAKGDSGKLELLLNVATGAKRIRHEYRTPSTFGRAEFDYALFPLSMSGKLPAFVASRMHDGQQFVRSYKELASIVGIRLTIELRAEGTVRMA